MNDWWERFCDSVAESRAISEHIREHGLPREAINTILEANPLLAKALDNE